MTIPYALPEASRVVLTIYDLMGREVMRWEQEEEAGWRELVWRGVDRGGRPLPSGVYIYRLAAAAVGSDERFVMTRKMLLLK